MKPEPLETNMYLNTFDFVDEHVSECFIERNETYDGRLWLSRFLRVGSDGGRLTQMQKIPERGRCRWTNIY